MRLFLLTVLVVAIGTVLVNFAYELFTDQDWRTAVEHSYFVVLGVLIFAWIVRGQVKRRPSAKEVNGLFGKFDQSGIRLGICPNCGKEMILEIPADTPVETVVEFMTNLGKVFDLEFSQREGDLIHFRIS